MNIETLLAKQEQVKVDCENAVVGGFVYKLQQYFRKQEKDFIEYFKLKYINVINHKQGIQEFVGNYDFDSDLYSVMDIMQKYRKQTRVYGVENAKLGVLQTVQFANDTKKFEFKSGSDATLVQYVNSSDYAKDAFAYIESQNAISEGNMLNKLGRNIDKVTAQNIYKELQNGFANLEDMNQLGDRIQGVFDGCSQSRALMIARTETMRAFNTSTIDSYKVANIELVQWLIANDERTCSICLSRGGQVFKIEGSGASNPLLNPAFFPSEVYYNASDVMKNIKLNDHITKPDDVLNFTKMIKNAGIDVPVEIVDFKYNEELLNPYSDKYVHIRNVNFNNLFAYEINSNNPKILLNSEYWNGNLSSIYELLNKNIGSFAIGTTPETLLNYIYAPYLFNEHGDNGNQLKINFYTLSSQWQQYVMNNGFKEKYYSIYHMLGDNVAYSSIQENLYVTYAYAKTGVKMPSFLTEFVNKMARELDNPSLMKNAIFYNYQANLMKFNGINKLAMAQPLKEKLDLAKKQVLNELQKMFSTLSVDEIETMLNRGIRNSMDKSELAIAINNKKLLKVLKDGKFKSQFLTGSSGGNFDPQMRSTLERLLFGYSDDIAKEDRVIYGFVKEKGNDYFKGARQYGDIEVIFKDSIKNKATWMFGDTLNAFRMPYKTADFNSVDFMSMPYSGDTNIYRSMMGSDWITKNLFAQQLRSYYAEAQLHGGVTPSDIQRVVITIKELDYPSGGQLYEGVDSIVTNYGSLIKGLRKLGVKYDFVYDGTFEKVSSDLFDMIESNI